MVLLVFLLLLKVECSVNLVVISVGYFYLDFVLLWVEVVIDIELKENFDLF